MHDLTSLVQMIVCQIDQSDCRVLHDIAFGPRTVNVSRYDNVRDRKVVISVQLAQGNMLPKCTRKRALGPGAASVFQFPRGGLTSELRAESNECREVELYIAFKYS